ncbi:MAG TPA: hypothetical protein VGO11_19835 [Chthoniobacteraceae bacterium]|jgi:hypothetical protein|nr:hypothetical protein [Chthoniobacteraceae bacterium]
MSDALTISEDGFALPLELAARTQAILAQKGAGKTYTALKQTELMLGAGVQVVALDPTGVWWGLRSPAAGKGGRGFAVVVLGGEHGDTPLLPSSGAVVADFVVSSGRSVVLDMSGFESNAAQDRFAADFAERLYRSKAADRATIHLMVDEADSFAPQRAMPGQQRMLGAFEAICRRGRSRGLGLTMISQRPAVLNKNVLSQVDLLICGRVTGPHDHKALVDWASIAGTKEQIAEFTAALPKLETGEAWVWSPQWLGEFRRVKIARRLSFDSSSTPAPGAVKPAAKMIEVDLAGLTREIQATIEEAKVNNPPALRKEVHTLNASIDELCKAAGLPVDAKSGGGLLRLFDWVIERRKGKEKRVEVPVLKAADLQRLGILEEKLNASAQVAALAATTISTALGKLTHAPVEGNGSSARTREGMRAISPAAVAPRSPHVFPAGGSQPATESKGSSEQRLRDERGVSQRGHTSTAGATGGGGGDVKLGRAERAILTVLAQYAPASVAKRRVALIAGYSVNGGGFNNPLSKLRTTELIVGSDPLRITESGRQAIGEVPPLPTGLELLNYWCGELGKAEGLILRALAGAPDGVMHKGELAHVTGYAPDGGGFNNPLSKLRTLELISGSGVLQIAEDLRR